MPTQSSTYVRAESLAHAWELFERGGDRARLAWTSPRPPDLADLPALTWIDVSALEINQIDQGTRWLTVGAGVSLNQLVDSEELRSLFSGLIQRASRKTAHYGLRNLASVGAVLQDPAAAPELSTALLACQAQLVYFDGSEQTVELSRAWQQGSVNGLPLAVKLDRDLATNAAGSIEWVGRSPMDRAIVVAASCIKLSDEGSDWVSVSLAGDGMRPQRVKAAEQHLLQTNTDDIDRSQFEEVLRAAIQPEASYRADSDYQQHLAGVLAWRAYNQAVNEVNG